jgi:hypothetical protein
VIRFGPSIIFKRDVDAVGRTDSWISGTGIPGLLEGVELDRPVYGILSGAAVTGYPRTYQRRARCTECTQEWHVRMVLIGVQH